MKNFLLRIAWSNAVDELRKFREIEITTVVGVDFLEEMMRVFSTLMQN